MRSWRVVPFAAALLTCACARGGAVCEKLRVPRASVEYTMVHIASFDEVYQQAVYFAKAFQLPAFKTADLTRQLLSAMEDMARFQTSEAMVNVTLDHTLTYAVGFTNLDGVAVEKDIYFTPEQSIKATIEAFCDENLLGDTYQERLEPQLIELLMRDWGCESVGDRAKAKPEPEPQNEPAEATTRDHSAVPSAKPPALKIRRKQSLPVLEVEVSGTDRLLTVSADQELELQATVLCHEWRTSLPDCLHLLDAMRNITRGHSAFTKPVRNRTRATSVDLQLHLSSPVVDVLHPRSERLYLDGEWWNTTTGDAVRGSYNVCVHFDLSRRPQFCGVFPPRQHDIWYVRPFSLKTGHHTVLLSNAVSSSNDVEDFVARHAIAARHFWIVSPTVELKQIALRDVDSKVFVELQIQTTAVDLHDPEIRVCVLVDAKLQCLETQRLLIESKTGIRDQTTTLFRTRVFGVQQGKHTLSVMLVNTVKKCFSSTTPLNINVELTPAQSLLAREDALFTEPPLATHRPLPVHCPTALPTAGLAWICDLWRHEWGRHSQNGEDGVLQSIFYNVGITNRVYVEFGTEDGGECNTRYLREVQSWTGLLMDGRFENTEINLHREWISPENINELFAKYDVPAEFDLLSVDVDFNDYWILDAVDRTRFSPRVLVIEINSHIPPKEPRVVKYTGPAAQWDGVSLYFGVGVGAMHLWGKRNGYSLVYCESRGVNCFLVRDDVLASVSEDEALVVSHVLRADDLYTPPNFFSKGLRYPPPTPESGVVEDWVWLDE